VAAIRVAIAKRIYSSGLEQTGRGQQTGCSPHIVVAGFGYLLLSQRKYGILSVGNQEEDAM
jgi:hypothetical protein